MQPTTTEPMVTEQARTPRTAIALLTVVGTLILFQTGIIVRRVLADAGGGSPAISVTVDTASDQVSATAGEFRVDESGAATYSVPLYLVPGTAGVAPQISLSYSSQGGYGPLGMGWSLGGMSSVSRCRATREHGDFIVSGVATDGTPEPVNFTASDRYCLDGQRLIPAQAAGTEACPSVTGMTVANLRTEIESFQRVCAYTPTSGINGPAFFTVERKDGSKSWYGDRAADTADLVDGYFNATTPGKEAIALSWAQTRFQDSTGNYIDYLYTEKPAGGTAGEQLISEVRYTGKKVLSGQSGSASAPYAKVVFNYSARPTTQWEYRYSSGGQYLSSRRLDSVTVCTTIACATGSQARHYVLTYGTTVSNSARQILTSLKECRDNTQGVCMAPTTFEWSQANNNFVTFEQPAITLGDWESPYEGHKFGDVDGDGRLDMVYLLDGSDGTPCPYENILVGFSRLDGSNRLNLVNSGKRSCTPTELLTGRGDGSWHLLDYNGDGRDDLFVSASTGTGWRVYASLGDGNPTTIFDTSTNLIATLSPAIPSVAGKTDQVQLTDLNGDALMDIIYPSGGTLRARLMERTGATFGWGAERTLEFDWPSFGEVTCSPGALYCSRSIDGAPITKTGFTHMADFNGDAAADLLIGETVTNTYSNGSPYCFEDLARSQAAEEVPYLLEEERPHDRANDEAGESKGQAPMAPPDCEYWTSSVRYLNAVAVTSITATAVTYASKAKITYPLEINLGDVNADGLTDLFYQTTSGGNWFCSINTGNGFGASCDVGTIPNPDKAQFVDISGDGRTDVLYPALSGNLFSAKYALPSGGWAAAVTPGSGAFTCYGVCGSTPYINLFADLDGDAAPDHVSIRPGASPDIFVSRSDVSTSQFKPRDTITAIVNGFGARTELIYKPLTNNAVYRRDYGSRDTVGTQWGRGAPVQDLLAPMYVVAKASSSSPQDGNPSAVASLYYRYAGAKVQAGGRGYLGFREIVTFDPNQVGGYVATVTSYSQNFPFVGMPAWTKKLAFNGQTYSPATCITAAVTNSCYSPSASGQGFLQLSDNWFGFSEQSWEADTDNTASNSSFAAGVQAPIHVRTQGTQEQVKDALLGSPVVTSRVVTSFSYGTYGNVTGTTMDTYGDGATLNGSIATVNTYTVDNPAKWRLGRLDVSTVTHSRPGKTNVVKSASFVYDLAPGSAYTGQLTKENTQPTGGNDNLTVAKVYTLDAYGNRTRVSTCSTDITNCGTTGVNFHSSAATSINRYSKVTYDSLGRYPVTTAEPFWNGSGAIERVTQTVVGRNIFGDVTQAYNVNGLDTVAVTGTFGRAYYSWTETVAGSTPGTAAGGIDSLSYFRWCGGGGGVDCPNGAKFRQATTADGAPSQWVYFDGLGRPILKAGQTFNSGVSGKDVVAVCTTYDGTGKPKRASNPFFLAGTIGAGGPTSIATVCTDAARKWTTTTYDLLGRPTRVDAPDTTFSTLAYNGNQTTATDARSKSTTQVRNGQGELISVTDADGIVTAYDYTADGNQASVTRNAGRGQIQNLFTYDARGRKTQQNDPDSGVVNLTYNALGELIAQQDAAGNRIEFELDARGRVWRKTVKRADTSVETQSTFVFDTATNGVGLPTSETVTGTYTDWVGDSALAHSYSRGYGYDSLGRGVTTSTTVNSVTYTQTTVLDGLGRAWKHQDVSGSWNKDEYSLRGFKAALCISDATDSTPTCPTAAWQRTEEIDVWGNIISEKRANSGMIPITRSYNPLNGRPTALCAGATSCNLVNELYAWDNAGNLSTQQKEGRYLETFSYDNLNRLTNAYLTMVDGVSTNTLTHWGQFDALGNVCARLFLGTGAGMGYGGRAGCGVSTPNGDGSSSFVGAHRLTTVYAAGGNWNYNWDARGNQTVRDAPGTVNDRTIKYSLDDQAHEIVTGNGKRTRYWYGPDGQRYKRQDIDGTRTLYLGQVEVIINGSGTSYRRNIQGVLIKTEGAVPVDNRFVFTDRLGSIAKYTNGSGAIVYQQQDYDNWGQRRDYDDPTIVGAAAPTPPIGLRGFTGHEMIDGQDVVNMNARMYDPMLGRFLQADPIIQAPENLQSWNAYTYVFNNPLTLVDPTGMFSNRSFRSFLQIFQTVLNYAAYLFPQLQQIANIFNYAMHTYNIASSAYYGGFRGGLISAFMPTNLNSGNAYLNILGNTVAAGVQSELMGGTFRQGAVIALRSAAISFVVQSIVQGVISAQTGGKSASGASSKAYENMLVSKNQTTSSKGSPQERKLIAESAWIEALKDNPRLRNFEHRYIDQYAFRNDSTDEIVFDSDGGKNVSVLGTHMRLEGPYNEEINLITLYRAGVESKNWVYTWKNIGTGKTKSGTIPLTGKEMAIWVIGHEFAHGMYFDVERGVHREQHVYGEYYGYKALMDYRARQRK